MKAKLYIETTIPSYLVGRPSRDLLVAAHQEITRDWWEFRRTHFDLYVSELVLQESAGWGRPARYPSPGTSHRRSDIACY
jgi:hypothetical protein